LNHSLSERPLLFALSLGDAGTSIGEQDRQAQSRSAAAEWRSWYRQKVQLAESAGFAFILERDPASSSPIAAESLTNSPIHLDGYSLMGYLAGITSHIGLIAEADVRDNEPFHVARSLSSLDHASSGRAGWKLAAEQTAADYGERKAEFFAVAMKLWDSWDDEAVLADQAGGRFLDRDRVRTIDHRGRHFNVAGPLSIPRPLQGYPVLATEEQSVLSDDYAARWADIVMLRPASFTDAIERNGKIKRRLQAEARQFALIKIEVTESMESVAERDKQDPIGSDQRGREAKPLLLLSGTAEQLADELQYWFGQQAVDGFILSSETLMAHVKAFVEQVIPLLEQRGIVQRSYQGQSLRENIGLSRPGNRLYSLTEEHQRKGNNDYGR
jgi:alkanesulfonate monooxygenase SsuD/methylene tetrahydromethanopterin reductase-like flavin-dependent oxidoreductase (luciferase family)